MKKLTTYGECKKMMGEIIRTSKKTFSNFYFLPADVERYIDLGRAYYEEVDAGVIFIFDEELYYKVCVVVDAEKPLNMPKFDKKVLIRNIFREEKRGTEIQMVEENLKKLNFRKIMTNVQIQANVPEMYEKRKMYEEIVFSLESKGYRCIEPNEVQCEEIERILLDSQMIKDYHLDYFSDEERRDGNYLCIIDENEELCAVCRSIVKNRIAQLHGVAVIERCKKQGFASALRYYQIKYLFDNDAIYLQGWIRLDNQPSLQLHTKIGYKLLDKYADDWIRDVEE